MLVLSGPMLAGPLENARDAVDPDCTVAKAARGAAGKAAIGVRSSRCDVAETTRDTLGIDDRNRKNDGLLGRQDDDGLFDRRDE